MPRTKNKQNKLHIKKGDQVQVISGNHRGEQGRVLRVYPQTQRVLIEGINIRIRHTRPGANKTYPEGGRIEREMPVHASNVQPLDGNGKPTRIGRKWLEGDSGRGHWVRYAKTTGEDLD